MKPDGLPVPPHLIDSSFPAATVQLLEQAVLMSLLEVTIICEIVGLVGEFNAIDMSWGVITIGAK